MSETAVAGVERVTALERALRRARVPDHVARVLAATPTMRWSWLGAAAAAVGFCVGAAAIGERATLPFLVAAPLLPLGGVAIAYGPWADPMDELTRAAPMSSVRLLLLRATAVLATTALGVGVAVALLPSADLPAVAWLLPALALTTATLALSTVVATHVAAAIVTGGWLLVVVAAEVRSDVAATAFGGPGQLGFFVVAVGSAGVLAARHERLERDGRERRQRLIDAAEHERRRIERNLHDGAQQQLVAISVKLGLAKGLVEKDPVRAAALLETLQDEAKETLESLREMTRGACPPALADGGLAIALTQHAAKAPVQVEVRAEHIGRFPLHVETAVYYCCLEALQNAAKHAGAARVVISLRRTGGELAFTVADDGAGFDPSTVRRGVGLRSLEERIEALGGSLEVRASPGEGAVIAGRVPCGRGGEPHQDMGAVARGAEGRFAREPSRAYAPVAGTAMILRRTRWRTRTAAARRSRRSQARA